MATPTQTPAVATTAQQAPASTPASKNAPGLAFTRHFSKPGVSPYDEITWERRDAVIQDWKGNLIFEQKNVEVPADWSVTATNIVASKYLHGLNGTDEREDGVRALMLTRIVVAMFYQQPIGALTAGLVIFHAHEHPAPPQALAREDEF